MKRLVFITFLAILSIPELGRADSLPTVGLSYDLQEVGLTSEPTHKGVLNQLRDVSFVRMVATDLDDVYVLKATFNSFHNGISYGQATELMALDTATGQLLIPKNITTTGEHKCIPAVSGTTAKFHCVYRLKDNKITETSTIHLFIYLPNSLVLFNTKPLEPKDFIPPAPPPTPPVAQCGEHQGMLNGKCVCSTGYQQDPKTMACVPNLDINPPQASPAGGQNCSLNPNATPHFQPQSILALLLMAMIAARACVYSKN